MLHFLTGFYYFTWFENLLIIIAGLSLGHFLSLIVRQVQLIRHHRPLTRTLIEMAPWFVILLVLMLSPVFASGIAVGWMVIIGLLEYVVEYFITVKIKQSHSAKLHACRKKHHHESVAEEFDNDDFDDTDTGDGKANSHYDDADSTDALGEQLISHMAQTPQHDSSSAEPVSHTANDAAPAASIDSSQTNQAAQSAPESQAEPVSHTANDAAPAASVDSSQTNQAGQSAPESQAEQVPTVLTNTSSSASVSAPAASHQPTSQELMDHMFDFDPNVDYEATAKSDTSAASDDQSASETQVASSAPAVSEQPSSQEAMDHVFDFDPNVNYAAEAASAAKADKQSEAGNDENNN